MSMKRYLIEFGTGVDLHGSDCTKAAVKALKDAVSHCCMAGIAEIIGVSDPMTQMRLQVKVAAPYPERVDAREVALALPGGGANADIEVVAGGMTVRGLHVEAMGAGDNIVVVNAAITVCVDVSCV